jgi:hypothetical protein
MLVTQHRLFQVFLVIGKQCMNLPVRFVADRVNLRSKFLPRCFPTLAETALHADQTLGASLSVPQQLR